MSKLTISVLLAGAVACGGASATSSPAEGPASNGNGNGATSAQGTNEAARALTHEECLSLGQSISDACNGTNTRSAQFEGWCSDVITGIGTGSWVTDCEKHIKYMDAVCITSNTSIRSMMDCDSAVQR
ncbi:MAG TPA: hypothetical protein VGG39_20490 [Polyangiaceae bacterium]